MAGLARVTIHLLRADVDELKHRAKLEKKANPATPASWQAKARILLHRAVTGDALKIWKFQIPPCGQKDVVRPAVLVNGVETPIDARLDLGRRLPLTDIYVAGYNAVIVEETEAKARLKLARMAETTGLDARWLAVADVMSFDYAPGLISWVETA